MTEKQPKKNRITIRRLYENVTKTRPVGKLIDFYFFFSGKKAKLIF